MTGRRAMMGAERIYLAGMVAALAFAAAPAADASPWPASKLTVAQAETGVDQALVGDIQRLLSGRGFDAGPADGIMGARTRQAIVDYQISAGLPANGVPSRSLYDHLTAPPPEPKEAAIPADTNGLPDEAETGGSQPEARPAAIPADQDTPPATPSLAGTAWRFVDSTGGEFSLAFLPDGTVEGILYARFWRWRQTGDDVVISYDNGMGLRVTRPGRLSGPAAMSGRAEPSRGEPWSWTAERITTP